jgi:septum formation protein
MFVLASASPRRLLLLQQAGLHPIVVAADIDETPVPGESALDYAQRMATQKCLAVLQRLDSEQKSGDTTVVLAADTVVHRNDCIFDKPLDRTDAIRILTTLADSWHTVTTAFCIATLGNDALAQHQVSTQVRFRQLDENDISRYLESGEAMDKAGAYGIQGLGGALVDSVEGSYTNVVGLPLPQVLTQLRAVLCGAKMEKI